MIRTWLSLLTFLLPGFLAANPAQADWPQFRGPTGQGHAESQRLPTEWSATQNVAWKQPVPGLAWSSPAIVDGKIYLTTAAEEGSGDEKSVTLGAVCLDADTGKSLWSRQIFTHTGDVAIHKKNSHASPSPIVEGEALFVHFGPHGTARLTLDGNVVWKQKLDYSPVHGNGGSPALAENLLIICCDGGDEQYVVGLDQKSGDIVWKTERDTSPDRGFSFGTPLVISAAGRQQAICPGSDAVFAYEPATGKEIWRVRYEGGYSVIPRPVFGNGLVYVCTGYNRPSLLAIDPTGTGDVTQTHLRWQTDRQVPHSASPVLVDQLLFFVADKGIARCVDAVSGEGHWEERLGGNFSASPLHADGKVYFQDETGTATVVAAAPEFRVIAKNQITEDERTFASYAVSDHALFIRTESHLFRIEATSR